MRAIDLHSHSLKSDGTFSPSELMAYAAKKNLKAIALTDHDTTAGLNEAADWVRRYAPQMELVPGIEFSTIFRIHEEDHDIHVVGLFINYHLERFQQNLRHFIESRITRNHKMCEKLTEAGMPVTYEQLMREFQDGVITRAHCGRYLFNHGYVKSIKEAFEKYIGEGCPCYVPREKVTPVDAVRMIREAEGVPVLAHPMLYRLPDADLRVLLRTMKEAGLVGIEAIYPTHTEADERYIRKLAQEFDLRISGGSDFHGENKPGLDLATGYGHLFVPEDLLEKLREKRIIPGVSK